jgi:hypothetical protein
MPRRSWRAIRDPQQRLERALDELYAYYERTEPMLSHALAFSTWRSLSTNGIGRSDAATLMTALVAGAATRDQGR